MTGSTEGAHDVCTEAARLDAAERGLRAAHHALCLLDLALEYEDVADTTSRYCHDDAAVDNGLPPIRERVKKWLRTYRSYVTQQEALVAENDGGAA